MFSNSYILGLLVCCLTCLPFRLFAHPCPLEGAPCPPMQLLPPLPPTPSAPHVHLACPARIIPPLRISPFLHHPLLVSPDPRILAVLTLGSRLLPRILVTEAERRLPRPLHPPPPSPPLACRPTCAHAPCTANPLQKPCGQGGCLPSMQRWFFSRSQIGSFYLIDMLLLSFL